MSESTRSPLSRKLLLSLGILGAVGAVAGLGTYAQFTSSTSADHTVTTGTMTMALTGEIATGHLTAQASDMAPGDAIERTVDLKTAGTIDLSTVKFDATETAVTAGLTAGANPLALQVDRCSVAWTGSDSTGFTCSGTTTSVVATGANVRSIANIASTLDLVAGHDNFLRIKSSLPSAADNTYKGLSSTFTYTFTGTQRAGKNI